jgi:hypothetical protein
MVVERFWPAPVTQIYCGARWSQVYFVALGRGPDRSADLWESPVARPVTLLCEQSGPGLNPVTSAA